MHTKKWLLIRNTRCFLEEDETEIDKMRHAYFLVSHTSSLIFQVHLLCLRKMTSGQLPFRKKKDFEVFFFFLGSPVSIIVTLILKKGSWRLVPAFLGELRCYSNEYK